MPHEYVGAILKLCQERRGVQKDIKYLGSSGKRVQVTYEHAARRGGVRLLRQAEERVARLRSLDYELAGYRDADLVKLDMLVNGDAGRRARVIVHRERAYQRGRDAVCAKLKELIPQQMFEVAIQAAIGSRRSSRARPITAMRKNVLAKCYGGDITRKRKLLEKQKEGKKRMKQVGSVEIPQEAFLAVLKTES